MLIKLWSLLLVTVICPVGRPTINFRRLAEKDLRTSVLLRMTGKVTEKDGTTKPVKCGCSGTYVSPNRILTAAHCFEGYQLGKVFARGPEDPIGYRVRVVRVDHKNDLALVAAPLGHPYATLGPQPHVGEEVMNIGSPLIFEFAVSEGIVSVTDFTTPMFGGKFTITTAMINPGSSGGGAFNKKGQLIGVNTRSVGLFGWTGLSLAVDVETIRKFLL